MRRGPLVGALMLLAIWATVAGIAPSGASLTHASSSTVAVSTGNVQNLLHMYSQSSDPDGLGNFYKRPGTSTPAATGADETLAVDLGRQSNKNNTCNRVFTIKAPASFPTGITSVTVSASAIADPGTEFPQIKSIGFAPVGSTSRTNPVSLSAGAKMQCNLVVTAAKPTGTVYHPTVLITVTYAGFTGTFFRYSVPFTVTAT